MHASQGLPGPWMSCLFSGSVLHCCWQLIRHASRNVEHPGCGDPPWDLAWTLDP